MIADIIRYYIEYTAEEMGTLLKKAAYSPNIKERMDHSCAIFDWKRRMIAQAEHIPVHLGAMPLGVKKALEIFHDDLRDGDVIIFNDPYIGGTHLPDITLIQPVYYEDNLIGYSVTRAHHSDVGGKVPGSMPGDAIEIFEEGLRIPPIKIVKRGEINKDVLNLILLNSRTPRERKGDLLAQISANKMGAERLKKIVEKYGLKSYMRAVEDILNYAEKRVRKEIEKLPKGIYSAIDYMDDTGIVDKPVKIKATIKIENNKMVFDFTGTDKQVDGPINAPLAVTISASYYVLKAVTDPTIPANEGAYRPLEVIAPEGTVVNAKPPAAISGGNVETSQRIVDVLLKAFSKAIPDKIPAAAQGTMNNISIGGIDPRTGESFTFYETIGGGYGARKGLDGENGVHSHMTNTLNTPIEEIERRFPIMILKYSLREDSGGKGRWKGGDGIERVYLAKTRIKVSLMGERHKFKPWGLQGGEPGKPGEYILVKKSGEEIKLPSKTTIIMEEGDKLIIRTPGGGGYGE